MKLTERDRRNLVQAMAEAVFAHAAELTELDRAIGDADHGVNMQRGFEAVVADIDRIAAKPLPELLVAVGTTLVMKVGGASGPLYGTLFLQLGKNLPPEPSLADLLTASEAAIAAVKARGRSEVGCKTMLDVLTPALETLRASEGTAADGLLRRLPGVAQGAAEATLPLRATRGRASYLGERSVGHMDPGARSSALLITAVCGALEAIA